MYLNLCNAKFSIIEVENRVYGEVILSLHFSIAFYNMQQQQQIVTIVTKYWLVRPSNNSAGHCKAGIQHVGITEEL